MDKARKRSSLKHENIFPEGLTLEQFVEMNKNKSIKWDQKVIIEEDAVVENEIEEKAKVVENKDDVKFYLKLGYKDGKCI